MDGEHEYCLSASRLDMVVWKIWDNTQKPPNNSPAMMRRHESCNSSIQVKLLMQWTMPTNRTIMHLHFTPCKTLHTKSFLHPISSSSNLHRRLVPVCRSSLVCSATTLEMKIFLSSEMTHQIQKHYQGISHLVEKLLLDSVVYVIFTIQI